MWVFRVGNCNIAALQQLREMSFSSRRIWVSISDPHSPWRKMTDELRSSSEAWRMLSQSTPLVYSMLPRPILECHAAVDAMATDTVVGIGGYIIFHSCISGWYQLQLGPSDFQDVAPWAAMPFQRNICVVELLGQCLLLQLMSRLLKGCRQHCTVMTACVNTSGEVAATKGISSSIGISNIFSDFFRYQLLYDIFQQVQHILGYRNATADALSRFGDHGLPSDRQICVDWRSFATPMTLFTMPSDVNVSTSFGAIERV